MMRSAERRDHKDRLERLRILCAYGDFAPGWMEGLAYEYREEARLCWYIGAFVAAIVMSQLAFEEVLRSHYRAAGRRQWESQRLLPLDKTGFTTLIDKTHEDGLITPREAASLHELRKDYRNPFVHPHGVRKDATKPDFFRQHMKIVAPQSVGESVELEAKKTIILLIRLLPKICRRSFCLHSDG